MLLFISRLRQYPPSVRSRTVSVPPFIRNGRIYIYSFSSHYNAHTSALGAQHSSSFLSRTVTLTPRVGNQRTYIDSCSCLYQLLTSVINRRPSNIVAILFITRLRGTPWRGGLSVAIVWLCKEERKNKRANIPICPRIVCQSGRSECCDCLSWSAFFCVSRKTFCSSA